MDPVDQVRRSRRETIEAAAELRAGATRLRKIADRLAREAEELEVEVYGSESTILRGRDIVDKVLQLTEPGQEFHYTAALRLIRAAGFTAAGVDPEATFLASINRAPEFERIGTRTGRYRRMEAEGS